MKAFRDLKIWIRLVGGIAVLLAVAWSVMIASAAYGQRSVALHQAKSLAASVYQMTMANLLFMKVTKTIEQRSLYYEQVRQSEAVKDLRILRGPTVVEEMGRGDAIAMNPDPFEQQVMKDGKPFLEEVVDPQYGLVLRAIFPAKAVKNYLGKDCLECHSDEEGTVLGAVSMKIALQEMDDSVRREEFQLIGVALAISIPMFLLIFFFVRSVVTRPLDSMASGLQEISHGDADLTKRLPVAGRDEIGVTADAFNSMMAKLGALISGINNSAQRLSSSAGALQQSTVQVARSSDEQSAQSAGVATAVEQMSASISSVADSSNNLEQLSRHSRERTQAGLENLDQLKSRLGEVEDAVATIANTVDNFVKKTASISSMTGEVKAIADQTNLLALNAAIEAARAGEHGRGFAVVADEVRKLAEKSSRSASEIDAITHSLNSESNQVNQAIIQGREVLAASHESMLGVAGVLHEAAETVEQVASGMSGIRSASAEQNMAAAQIAASVETISEAALQNASAVEAMSQLASGVAELANGLEDELRRFKT